jgi:hypothetical protein
MRIELDGFTIRSGYRAVGRHETSKQRQHDHAGQQREQANASRRSRKRHARSQLRLTLKWRETNVTLAT